MKSRTDIYQDITDKIVAYLEEGVAKKWIKPWVCLESGNQLSIVNRPYNGINQLLLSLESHSRGFQSNHWATYQGFKKIGAQVKRGEKATDILFYKKLETKKVNPKTNKTTEETIYVARSYAVFNGDQVEGYEDKREAQEVRTFNDIKQGSIVRNLVKAHDIELEHKGDRAFYRPLTDSITMPCPENFENASRYYETLLHEITHWTGHSSRLDREGITKYSGFGSNSYAFEELVAELGSAFTSQALGVSSQEAIREDHLPYIQSWINGLKEDKKAIVKASALAQASTDYLLKKVDVNSTEESLEESLATI